MTCTEQIYTEQTCLERSRSRRFKIYHWILTVVICLAVLAISCEPSAEEAKIQVEPRPSSVIRPPSSDEGRAPVEPQGGEPVEPQGGDPVEPQGGEPVEPQGGEPVELSLKFTPQDLTTYKVTTEAVRTIKGEGSLSDDSTFKGGTTSNKIEITFTQQIKSVDDNGNAVAEVTIKGIKALSEVKDNVILDFDSSGEKNLNDPIGALVGQSYTIELTAAGDVSNVIDASQAQAAVRGDSAAQKRALELVSQDAIKKRHSIPALSACGKNQIRTGDNWTSVDTLSFGMMGTKSYERIYTLKEIKDEQNSRLAVIEMNAVPSAELTQEQRQEQSMGIFSKMFDNTETYTGRLEMDFNTGKINEYFEKLQCEWVAVDPTAAQNNEEPAVLRMAATRLYRIEKIE